MLLMRQATISYLEDIHKLALKSGSGLTTLPKDIDILKSRLLWSDKSFNKPLSAPEHEYYLFVLEDTKTNQVVGTSGIESQLGVEVPFYSYKLSKRTRISHELNIRASYDTLNLVNDKEGHSEICTLYLDPEYRHGSNGLLLSKARFLFMAEHRERFAKQIMAEMRGISDNMGYCPFWEAICKHFFQMSFTDADLLSISTNKQFIADLMPRQSIYIKLLPKEAQHVIGITHPSTTPAKKILEKEGFRFQGYIDIFDAGPTLEAPLDSLASIKHSLKLACSGTQHRIEGDPYIVATTSAPFRAALTPIDLDTVTGQVTIVQAIADALHLEKQDVCRIIPLSITV